MWMEQIGMEPNGREELLNPSTGPKLCLTMFNSSGVYDIHDRKNGWKREKEQTRLT